VAQQTGREVDPFDVGKTQLLERAQTISSTTEEVGDRQVLRPAVDAQGPQALVKLGEFLPGRLEVEIGLLPLRVAALLSRAPVSQSMVGHDSLRRSQRGKSRHVRFPMHDTAIDHFDAMISRMVCCMQEHRHLAGK
jgi:hypothetical protein